MNGSRLLIIGCGYVGKQVAKRAVGAGQTVFALTRSRDRFEELRSLGISPIEGDWSRPPTLRDLPSEVNHLLISVPHRVTDDGNPQSESREEQDTTHARGLKNLLAALPNDWQRLCYLSTTGVYGENSQQAVNEDTPASPTRTGPRMALAAEQWLLDGADRQRVTVLRLAGIYGPGRIPLREKLRNGQPLAVPRQGHVNLAHRDDIAEAIMRVFSQPMQRPLYVFSDGSPVLREDFYQKLAELCGLEQPVFVAPDEDSPRARRATDKQVDPSRFLSESKIELRFPDYHSGLADAVSQSAASADP